MKVVLLGNGNSVHIVRWANGLVSRGVEVHLVSAHTCGLDFDSRVKLHKLSIMAPWGYMFGVFSLRGILRKIKPDIINAHYASGYGLLARLSGFKPLLLSIWGSDVYAFPRKSKFHRYFLKENLKAATAIASTSQCMAVAASKIYKHRHVFITPFGVNETHFILDDRFRGDDVVIGTVKSLKSIYGIDILLDAFSKVLNYFNGKRSLRLEITGGGPDLNILKEQAVHLGISEKVIFNGPVNHDDIPRILNGMDVYVALSREESFGVAALEASSCEKPVVVSDAEGLAEVTVEGVTGFVVPKDNPQAASEAIIKLVQDASLRKNMGRAGREHVLNRYTWEHSLDVMLEVYRCAIAIHKER
ncbi:glycosyltransferase [Pseudomonas borbori]|uniref:Glycosyltransferase involved in cell wall bisynthesis n=1 Tax=Pseudomonas borbori TaxID=289003 RepID=A0A1I5K4F6_9PSED|nr:glycosyltransferase [Pseudomonas borbori]SFO79952.1 Glycosyltransferase involved in cell wall bisynthesis [Pseudomonas borbori]